MNQQYVPKINDERWYIPQFTPQDKFESNIFIDKIV